MTNKRPTLSIKSAKSAAPRIRPSYEVKPVLQPGYRPDLKPDSLALCLLGAANAVSQVRAGTTLPQALLTAFGVTNATPQARGAIQDSHLPSGLMRPAILPALPKKCARAISGTGSAGGAAEEDKTGLALLASSSSNKGRIIRSSRLV